MRKASLITIAATAALFVSTSSLRAEPEPERPHPSRITPTVKLINKCLPSVVSIRAFRPHENPGVFYINSGSGAIVHPDGYILTNAHVIRDSVRAEVLIPGREKPLDYRIICKFSHEDIALVKVDAGQPLTPLALGRSHDLMLGEPTLVIGMAAGLAHSASTGIVSGLNRSTNTQDTFLPWVIQTSAPISGGSSGGPMMNALGEMIGIITSRKEGADNVGFAIAVDRIREQFPKMLAAEQRYGFQLGLDVDMLSRDAKITSVKTDSVAAKAGIQPGDVVVGIGDQVVRHGMDFCIGLIGRKAEDMLTLKVRRGDKTIDADVTLSPVEVLQPIKDEKMTSGLEFAAYEGNWSSLPDFEKMQPAVTGTCAQPGAEVHKKNADQYGLRFNAFIKIPTDGVYTFCTSSDDGSRLYLADQLIVDNDGMHPVRHAAGVSRLSSGLHPFRIEFFDAGGEQSLKVFVEGPKIAKQEIPADWYFRRQKDATVKE